MWHKKYEGDIETKTLSYQSTAKLDKKILFGKITHHLDPENRTTVVNDKFGNEDSTFHSGP